MRNAIVLAFLAVALACSPERGEQTGPSTIPPSSPSPTPAPPSPTAPSRVVVSGTVSAATNGSPIPNARVQVVDGANAQRQTYANDVGFFTLADLEPGTLTLQFTGGSEFVDLQRIEVVQADTTLNVQLEQKGFVLSGRVTTQWGEPIGDAGVHAERDGRVVGGGSTPLTGSTYRIPTLPAGDYIVRVIKWGYTRTGRQLTLRGDTTLDLVADRVRVSLFGTVREAAAACGGAIEGVEVEIVSGPDVGVGAKTTATGYQTTRTINWGKVTLRASKIGYVPAEMSIELLPPGWSCGTLPAPPESPSCPPGQVEALLDVRQDFVLQRTGSC